LNFLSDIARLIIKSLPLQLIGLHFRKNQALLLFWIFLFVIISKQFGVSMGIPYLFLDPEYMNEVGFLSFFIMGGSVAGFIISFHITTYIIDGQSFNFLGWLEKPFTRFSLNNSLIPLVFIIVYTWNIVSFQYFSGKNVNEILLCVGGFYTGLMSMSLVLFLYFWWTNKDIFKYVVCKLDEKLKNNVKATRARALSNLVSAKQQQVGVDWYMDLNLKLKRVPDYKGFYDKFTVLQVFDQNHFNLISIELFVFVVLLIIGIFSDYPWFQIPAASSVVLLLTILIMFTGAFSYWFRGWSVSLAIFLILIFNYVVGMDVISKEYKAFGLDYQTKPAVYDLNNLIEANQKEKIQRDKLSTIKILEKWRNGFPKDKPPKLIFICASGGGLRSTIWTLNALQNADSITNGMLMKNTVLMTGASGGLIGSAYFRELKYQEKQGKIESAISPVYLKNIARDHLNPIIFAMLVNDIFLGFQEFDYGEYRYEKDRGYAFEQQLNRNSFGFLDKTLSSYKIPEQNAEIPMLILAPTIVNDGRKLYISPQDISYLNQPSKAVTSAKIKGIEFREFYKNHNGDGLRFLSALRMSATFPYVTPNISLPSIPKMEIMDAGLTDNYGITDATRFLYNFSDWIYKNTSGVIFLTIRDSQKNNPIEEKETQSLFQRFSSPIQGFYKNFENIQDIFNDNRIEEANSWFQGDIYNILIEYNPENNALLKERASLNWRLTEREKQSVIQNIHSDKNITELQKLRRLIVD